jgi:Arc/MetJ-type ribon-helix-helix transcriptional regulator
VKGEMRTLGKNKKNENILVEFEEELVEKIDHIVDAIGQFKSHDDFIELACHEFMVRRNPAAALLG